METPDINSFLNIPDDDFLDKLLANLDNDISALLADLQGDTDEFLEKITANLDKDIENMLKYIS